MESAVIQRQYDDVIASQYDQDPQNTTSNSLERALDHLDAEGILSAILPAMRVLDVGMGTGMFLEKLRSRSQRVIEPWGIDISEKMASIAKTKLPDLVCAIDDGANLDHHFNDEKFDLVATPTTKHEDVAGEDVLGGIIAGLAVGTACVVLARLTPNHLVLYQRGQAVESFPHVGDPCSKPYPCPGRYPNQTVQRILVPRKQSSTGAIRP